MKRLWVLAWILLSVYHLVDFALFFTPVYGEPLPLSVIDGYILFDIGKNMKNEEISNTTEIFFLSCLQALAH